MKKFLNKKHEQNYKAKIRKFETIDRYRKKLKVGIITNNEEAEQNKKRREKQKNSAWVLTKIKWQEEECLVRM